MSLKPIVHDPDIQLLQDAGLCVEITQNHLLIHQVPYVTAGRQVQRGIMITELTGTPGALQKPNNHQIWFTGEFPCYVNGTPLRSLNPTEGRRELWPGLVVQHRFSNKPTEQPNFPLTHSAKIRHYLTVISGQAAAIDPAATPYVFDPIVSFEPNDVFHYWDTASTRVGILAASAKFRQRRIAIIGLGGTGGYVLDQVAKTPVQEIHLFDGDQFDQHNAFRAPGAASIEVFDKKPAKVDYFAAIYSNMHKHIHPHHYYLDDSRLAELDNFDFVFLCVDKEGVRKLLADYLIGKGIPFADTGMELTMLAESNSILGTCRATMVTPAKSDHFQHCAPQSGRLGDDLYRSNIQVADINMLNAALAVHLWKKHCTFYLDYWQNHHHTFSIDSASLTRGHSPIQGIYENQTDPA